MSELNIARVHDPISRGVLPSELSDSELLSATRRLVGRSNQLLALLLGHLAEVEARGLHRIRACSSLYTYCIYELRFSEDEAFRRVAAARLVKRFPALLDAIASGELHLTGLLMLGPHLTSENLTEVLARSKHRTKKEIARLVRQLDPLPEVPARIEPLGPAPARVVPVTPTFRQFVESLCPVRDLTAGDRPRDWVDATEISEGTEHSSECSNDVAPLPAPARFEPQRYRVQFTACEEYVKLVEAAQALLSHSAERVPLDELQLRAMRSLVAELERKKRSARTATRANTEGRTLRAASTDAEPSPRSAPEPTASRPVHGEPNEAQSPEPNEAHPSEPNEAQSPEPNEAHPSEPNEFAETSHADSQHPRRRGRHIPAAVRRAVFERDQGRCAYIDGSGQRCRETHRLELHHLKAFALGGGHTLENLALRCSAHNALAAEQDFGADVIEQSRDSDRHESCRSQTRR